MSKLLADNVPDARFHVPGEARGGGRRAAGQERDLGVRPWRPVLGRAVPARAQSLEPGPSPAGSSSGSGRRGRGGVRAGDAGHRHRRLDPQPGRGLRHCRAEADLWPGQPARRDPELLQPRPCGPAGLDDRGCGDPAADHRRPRSGGPRLRRRADPRLHRGADRRRQRPGDRRAGGWLEEEAPPSRRHQAPPSTRRWMCSAAWAPRSGRSRCRRSSSSTMPRRSSRWRSCSPSTAPTCARGRSCSAPACAIASSPAAWSAPRTTSRRCALRTDLARAMQAVMATVDLLMLPTN